MVAFVHVENRANDPAIVGFTQRWAVGVATGLPVCWRSSSISADEYAVFVGNDGEVICGALQPPAPLPDGPPRYQTARIGAGGDLFEFDARLRERGETIEKTGHSSRRLPPPLVRTMRSGSPVK